MTERKKPRGFAAMTPEKRLAAARAGMQSLRDSEQAHSWTSESAKEAGRKGGQTTQRRRRERTEST